MADFASDQLAVAPPSGDSQAENTAALHAAAPEVASASVTAPPTTDAISKPDEPIPSIPDAPAATDGAAATSTDAAKAETTADKDVDAAAPAGSEGAAATNGTPKPAKKDNSKRKSISTPKGGNLKKQKSMKELHLNVEPGQIWWVRMKGYPNWPAIVCDEDMLPATLLEKRPVSAARFDGSYREDFLEGGKNARDRRYPVMFLGTNEFYWQVNTDLVPLDLDELKEEVAKGERGKKSVALWNAYQIASETHDLEHFKDMLKNHEEQLMQELQAKAEREAKKQEAAARKEARKSKGEGDEDVEMEGAEEGAAKKKKTPSKKRKEPAEGDVEEEQKGPKKIKIKSKGADEANTESAQKKKEKKPKAKKDETPAKPIEPELSPKEQLEKKEKNILFLRHKLQKGFLSRDQTPKEDEMETMSEHIKTLEQNPDLEVTIIRNTKINKVMKAILKLETIPKEDTYHFKDRSAKLLEKWNKILDMPTEQPAAPAAEVKPTVNGDSHAEETPKTEEAKPAAKDEPVETKTDLGNAAGDEGDVSMTDAKPTEITVSSAAATEEAKVEAPTTEVVAGS